MFFFFFWSSFYGYLLVRGKIKLLKVVEKFMLIEEVTIYDFGYGRKNGRENMCAQFFS